jgi:hypothetical protein
MRSGFLLKVGAAAAALVFAVSAIAVTRPTPTSAQTTTGGLTSPIPCTIAGVASTCTVTVTGFQAVNGVLTAAGTITGGGVTIPFSGVPVQASGNCTILDLSLGPLHLNLLGLVVDLNQVHLTITAQQGSGNLLGNLLCSVAHLLDSSASPVAIANHLNHILSLL